MKDIDKIAECKRLGVGFRSEDGISGEIHMARWTGTFIASWGGGLDHVSVTPYKKSMIPSWDDMCVIKDIFFDDNEAVIQVHPPKDEYVNNMPNCLHLWRCNYREMILPPSCFVGIRKGQTQAELNAEIKAAYELAGEKI